MSRRYRIRCGEAMHLVEMDEEGHLSFHAHADPFAEIDRERAMAVLSGQPVSEGHGCLRLAYLVRSGALSSAVDGSDDSRRLLAALRGIRLVRKMRRGAAERRP